MINDQAGPLKGAPVDQVVKVRAAFIRILLLSRLIILNRFLSGGREEEGQGVNYTNCLDYAINQLSARKSNFSPLHAAVVAAAQLEAAQRTGHIPPEPIPPYGNEYSIMAIFGKRSWL